MADDNRIPYVRLLDRLDEIATPISDRLKEMIERDGDVALLPMKEQIVAAMVLANVVRGVDPGICCQTINQFWALLELPISLTAMPAREREPDAPRFGQRR